MDKKISIIMPVYNGEKFISETIKKVSDIDDINFELIVVNDGSTDNTQKILNNIKNQFDFLKCYEKENEGVSIARNFGIEKSTGEYIIFLDSDDELTKNSLDILRNNLTNEDILIYGYAVKGSYNRKNDTKILNLFKENKGDKKELLKYILRPNNCIYGYAWRAIYKKSLLTENKIEFPKGIKISEDFYFFIKAVSLSSKTKVLDDEIYIYNIGPSSMSIKYIPSLLYDMNTVNKKIKDEIVKEDNELLKNYNNCVSNTYIRYVQNEMRDSNTSFVEKYKKIRITKKTYNFKKNIKESLKNKDEFDLKSYLSLIAFCLNLELIYMLLFKIKYTVGRNR